MQNISSSVIKSRKSVHFILALNLTFVVMLITQKSFFVKQTKKQTNEHKNEQTNKRTNGREKINGFSRRIRGNANVSFSSLFDDFRQSSADSERR
jgi:high-affinity nickel permease